MPSRYICDVLSEMRTCDKTRNFGPIMGLIEECQILANRMESCLSSRDSKRWKEDEYRELKKEIYSLEDKRDVLKAEIFEYEIKKLDLGIKPDIKVKAIELTGPMIARQET